MLRCMIVDDEPLVREGLKSIIDWKKCGFTICAEASDGEEALRALKKYNPDLAVIDIDMPYMSGLELSALAKSYNSDCKFIILSGHSKFSYAQEAIRCNVEEYFLKPIDEERLEDIVVKLREKIERERQLRAKESKYAKLEVQTAIFAFLANEKKSNYLPPILTNFNSKAMCLVVLLSSIDSVSKDTIMAFIPQNDPKNSFVTEINNEILWMISSNNIKELEYAYSSLQHSFFKLIYTAVVLCPHTQREIVQAYRLAGEILLRNKFYEKRGKMQWYEKKKSENACKIQFSNIGRCLAFSGIESTRKALHTSFEALAKDEISVDDVKSTISDMFIYAQNEVAAAYPNNTIIRFSDSHVAKEIHDKKTLSSIKDYLDGLFKKIADDIAKISSNEAVPNMIAFMEKHFAEDLKLEDLASIFKYNRAYIGRLFKTSTGESFNSYLERLRINKAQELLVDTKYKISDISDMVGFRNIDYFYKQFGKYTKEKPNEYRKKYKGLSENKFD